MSEAVVQERRLTADEFYDLYGSSDVFAELVNGKVVEMSPPAPEHGRLDSEFHLLLGSFVKQHRLGRVYLNTGFVLSEDEHLVRAPDQAFVCAERIVANPPPERGYWTMAPDLAVEIASPDDTRRDISTKVSEYLAAGVRLVWVVFPAQRQVEVHRASREVRLLFENGTLDGEDVLPGFRVQLAELWG